jgi:hypothetical protein
LIDPGLGTPFELDTSKVSYETAVFTDWQFLNPEQHRLLDYHPPQQLGLVAVVVFSITLINKILQRYSGDFIEGKIL